jgi:iron complex outermembrane recepter protein
MRYYHSASCCLFLCAVAAVAVRADHTEGQPEAERLSALTVYATPLSPWQAQPEWTPLAETNTAFLLKRIPGANVNFNGTLAGIPQYRGLFGSRVNVLLDGALIANACPNNMDASLHYMPRGMLDSLEVIRGIAPVSSGIETVGGTMVARSRRGDFAEGEAFEASGELNLAGQSVDRGYAGSGRFNWSNNRHRFELGASREQGSDRRFGGGFIEPTQYERNALDAGYGLHLGSLGELSFDFRRNETADAGTPALPMDDIYSDANLMRMAFVGRIAGFSVDSRIFATTIDHRMSNYELRPIANPAMRRFNEADAHSGGYTLALGHALFGGQLHFGVDGFLARNTARIGSPDDARFFLDNFRNARRDVHGFFGEWDRTLYPDWDLQMGIRHNLVVMDSSTVDASMAAMNMNLRRLRDRFNGADRQQIDHNTDAVLRVIHHASDALSLEWGLARKVRSPSFQERFLWAPNEAAAGLADGNVYTGAPDLRPETALQAEFGVDWRSARSYLAPRVFYHHIDNYIQGVPETDPAILAVAGMNLMPGANVLRFANVGARLYGLDTTFGWQLGQHWAFDGVLSWVRGERTDIDDDLYRIAPLNAVLDLAWQHERWSLTAETQLYAAQDAVSLTNREFRTPGYALLNLYGQYHFPKEGLTLSAGIENVLDKTYRPHLNGINRARGSDVAVGTRLPGDGINGFVQASWRF